MRRFTVCAKPTGVRGPHVGGAYDAGITAEDPKEAVERYLDGLAKRGRLLGPGGSDPSITFFAVEHMPGKLLVHGPYAARRHVGFSVEEVPGC